MTAPSIYNIPAGQPFARVLAQHLSDQADGKPEALSATTLLLPTRRACRIVQDAFLDISTDQGATLLPRLQPVGDLDEEELSLNIFGQYEAGQQILELAPAISPIQRQILLGELVQKAYPAHSQEQALKLAQALGHLIDQVHTQNLDMADLAGLVPEDFAEHWQITLKFLEIVSEHWPKILQERGHMDQAARRNALILALADFWEANPPQTPVIGAGSTGSIPSTSRLLSVVAKLPTGYLVLPGYDAQTDDASWEALQETHPQYGFKHLLTEIGCTREDVKPLKAEQASQRDFLLREIMRPAETSNQWMRLGAQDERKKIEHELKNLNILECENEREEAETIALILRGVLETPDKTACLITPDRMLAQRVKETCKRWNILLDDSAGESLKNTKLGIFISLILDTVKARYSPVSLLALLNHHLCHVPSTDLYALDLALRGLKPRAGFEGLATHIHERNKIVPDTKDKALALLESIEPRFAPIEELHGKPHNFQNWLAPLLAVAESFQDENTNLWRGEIGQKASAFFSSLFEETDELNALSFDDFTETLTHFMEQPTIRPSYGTHPRLHILGQLEARLIDADCVVLGGLNEGTWPSDPGAEPWMSRPMRQDFGLPSPERGIGLAAHDFAQGLSAPEVFCTRSIKSGGSPSVPARWLQRLDAVLLASGIEHNQIRKAPHLAWARELDAATDIQPVSQPKPCPPVETRPDTLSVTQIETWLRDPYSIYARHILKIEPLKPLEKPFDAADQGTLIHEIFEDFMAEHRDTLPTDSEQKIFDLAQEKLSKIPMEQEHWTFWRARFTKTARWFVAQEHLQRQNGQNLQNEAKGRITIKTTDKDFTLKGVADRIDKKHDGSAAIIDYKSGGQFSRKAMKEGGSPQLPLEALILAEGGFDNTPALKASSLEYWVFSGAQGGNITKLDDDVENIIEITKTALTGLIELHNQPSTTYTSLPNMEEAPRFNDYEHLSRVKEWGIASDDLQEDAA